MLNVLIALGIFGTILLFMQGCVLLHRVIAPRGVDRAIERLQSWSKPEVLGSQQIIQKEHYSDIAWLNEILHRIKLFQPLRTLYVQTDCPLQLGSLVMAKIGRAHV